MTRRKRVLFVAKWEPHGRSFGGLLRTVPVLDALASRYDVRVVGYREADDRRRARPAAAMRAYASGRAYQLVRYDTPWIRREIDRELARFRPDAVHAEYLVMAPPVIDLDLPKALDLHNVESALTASFAATARGPGRVLAARDARLLPAFEAEVLRRFDLVTVASANEAGRMPGPVEVLPNGVDVDRRPLERPPDPDLVCFLGMFGWQVNVDGAGWLVREVLPLLPPRCRVRLVGRDPAPAVRALAGERVEVTGSVPDTWPHLAAASVVVAPLLVAGGTRFKILEGLLAERPVVATTAAADGLEDLAGRGLVLADTPAEFASAVADLLADRAHAAELGRAGRAAVCERFGWPGIRARLLELWEARLGL